MPNNSSDPDRDDSDPDPSADPFAGLPPPPGSQPAPETGSAGETSPHQPVSTSSEPHRRQFPDEAPRGDAPYQPHELRLPSAGLLGALRWTALFFQVVRPDLRRVIGVVVLVGLLSQVAGLFVAPVLGLGYLLYFPTIVVLTGFLIIAAYDSIVGLQRSDIVRLKWAILRTPAVLATGLLWLFLAWLGTLFFVLPGLYLYVKGFLMGPAAVLEDGFALRPFLYSKAATHRNNLTVIGLVLVTTASMGLLAVLVGSVVSAMPVTMAGERLTAQEVQMAIGVTVGLVVFPLLAPAYTWVYVWNRPD